MADLANIFKMVTLRKGFTLIELLVVISVMAVLISILSASFTTAQKRARDAKRLGDMKSIQQGLEQCFGLVGTYPAAVTPGSALTCGNRNVIERIPNDPKNEIGVYDYAGLYSVKASDMLAYCLCVKLEKTGSGNANVTGTDGSCSLGTGSYQCVSNQQ